MTNRYTIVVWQGEHGFQAVIPALGMAPMLGETRRDAIHLCREVAQNRLTINTVLGLPMPTDVKVGTDHLGIRDDGQVRSLSSQYVPCVNTAMVQVMPQFADQPKALAAIIELFSELISALRETLPDPTSMMLLGGSLTEAIWTPEQLVKLADDLMDELIELVLPPKEAKHVRQVVRDHLSRELARVVPLDAELLGLFDGPFGPFGGLDLGFDDDDPFPADLDLSAIVGIPPPFPPTLPPALGPLEHPPGRKDRRRT